MTIQSLFCSIDIKFRREIKILDKQKQSKKKNLIIFKFFIFIFEKRRNDLYFIKTNTEQKKENKQTNERGHCYTTPVFVKNTTMLKTRRSLLF